MNTKHMLQITNEQREQLIDAMDEARKIYLALLMPSNTKLPQLDIALNLLRNLPEVSGEPVAKCTWGGKIEHLHEGSPSKLVGSLLYAAPQPVAVPQEWTNLLAYVLQGSIQNRLTPRVIDIAYNAFMLAKQPNSEDGGASDWFNDTKPKVEGLIAKLKKDLVEEFGTAPQPAAIKEPDNSDVNYVHEGNADQVN